MRVREDTTSRPPGWATAAEGAPANTDVVDSSRRGPATAEAGRRVSILTYGKDIRPISADTSTLAAGCRRGVGSASAHMPIKLGLYTNDLVTESSMFAEVLSGIG